MKHSNLNYHDLEKYALVVFYTIICLKFYWQFLFKFSAILNLKLFSKLLQMKFTLSSNIYKIKQI